VARRFRGLLATPVVMQTHGGRACDRVRRELHIDVASSRHQQPTGMAT
jgi:citrate lyase alpha subunit